MSLTSEPSVIASSRLAAALHGKVVLESHSGYDAARQAWNLTIAQRPAAVVAPESAQDVAAAVLFARERGQRVAPQGTGHGAWPMGSLADSVLLRTDRMRAIEIDPVAQVARVGAGALWRDVVRAAAEHGLAAVAGAPDVGVTGYTLGGGLSFLSRKYGLSCNRVTSVELVTADGRWQRIDAEHQPELFWAVRGGGGNFGVVTAIELSLFPLTEVYAGILWYPIERASEVLHCWRELTSSELPDELTTVGRFLKFPPIPEVPEPVRGQSFVVVEAFHAGDPRVADELLAGLRGLGPVMDTVASIPMPELGHVHMDPEQPTPVYGDGMMLADLTAETVDAFIAAAGADAGFPLLSVELRHLEGEIGRRRAQAGVLSRIDARYAMYAVTMTPGPELQVAAEHAIGSVRESLAPWANSQNYLNFSESRDELETFWPPEDFERLRAVRSAVDPDGVIRANHAIPVGR